MPHTGQAASLLLAFALALLPAVGAEDPAAAPFDRETIVFIGSSSIAFWKSLPKDFPEMKTLNLGKPGTTYSHLVPRAAEWAARYPAKRYVIYSGDNDVAWLRKPEKVARQFREVALALKAGIPDVRVYVISIKPNRALARRMRVGAARRANELLESEAEALGFATYVDIHANMLREDGTPRRELFSIDGIHMNRDGYRVWAKSLRSLLGP